MPPHSPCRPSAPGWVMTVSYDMGSIGRAVDSICREAGSRGPPG
jgi:hypothetical protein